MTQKKSFEERYRDKETPWELNRPDNNLIDFVTSLPVLPGPAIDLGCGTGSNAIWLASQGFRVTGCDLSAIALDQARAKAGQAEVQCAFHQMDFMNELPPGMPFSFAFDRGCFHTIGDPASRSRFAERVAGILQTNGQWLSLIGNQDEERDDRPGPPQLSATEVTAAVEPFFEIISLRRGHFDFNHAPAPLAWICHLRKRAV
jgi:SAM-dependent methyltransferase